MRRNTTRPRCYPNGSVEVQIVTIPEQPGWPASGGLRLVADRGEVSVIPLDEEDCRRLAEALHNVADKLRGGVS